MTQFCIERQIQNALVPKNLAKFLVAHLRKRRIHHEDQADRDRNGSGTNAEPVEEWDDSRSEPPRHYSDTHGSEYPSCQIAVEKS